MGPSHGPGPCYKATAGTSWSCRTPWRRPRWWPSTPRRSGVAGWDGRLGCRRLLVTVPVAALLPGDGRLRLPAADDALGKDLVAMDEAVGVRVVAGKPGVAAQGRAGPVLTERTNCQGAARLDWVAVAYRGHRHRPRYRASPRCCYCHDHAR